MIKCDNCAAEAEYISDPPFASTAYFCGSCIPWSLLNDYRAGLLPRVEQPVTLAEAPVAEEPVVEEPVVEEPVVETAPASKKKKIADAPADPGAADVSDN